MQRILSVETSRSGNTSSELITKRLCCSFLLVIAFFGIIGGFLLGKFVTCKSLDELKTDNKEISESVNILTSYLQNFLVELRTSYQKDMSERKIDCLSEIAKNNDKVKIKQKMQSLIQCFSNG